MDDGYRKKKKRKKEKNKNSLYVGIRARVFSIESPCLKLCFALICFDSPDPAVCISIHERIRVKSGIFLCFTADRVVSWLFIEYAMGLLCGVCGRTCSIQHQNLLGT